MAKKRMFRLDVLETDAFMEMPLTTQALYFHLCLRADDDGFVGNPRLITRTIGASVDDLKLLITKRFVLLFEDGVIVIKHWRLHNTLTANRYQETKYIEDKARLLIKENGAYSESDGISINDSKYVESGKRQTVQRQDIDNTKTSAEKKSKEEISIEKVSIDQPVSYFGDSELDSLFDEFLRIRKKLKAENSEIAITRLVNKVNDLSNGDKSMAMEIIGQSIENSWKGVFPVKKGKNPIDFLNA